MVALVRKNFKFTEIITCENYGYVWYKILIQKNDR